MRFVDEFFSTEDRFSLGTDTATGGKYISIPVSNQHVDYEEYYRIEAAIYEKAISNLEFAKTLADRCRRREMDQNLIIKPGNQRGSS